MASAHQRAFYESMLGHEPLRRAKSPCVGWWGRVFGHNWLTCSQVEPVPEENRLRAYTARRCRRCYAEDADFGRHYRPPQTVEPGGIVMLGEHPPFALPSPLPLKDASND